MKKNMGVLDSIIRLVLALIVLFLYLNHQLTGTAFIILAVVAVILIITSFFGFCPLYALLRINTRKSKQAV